MKMKDPPEQDGEPRRAESTGDAESAGSAESVGTAKSTAGEAQSAGSAEASTGIAVNIGNIESSGDAGSARSAARTRNAENTGSAEGIGTAESAGDAENTRSAESIETAKNAAGSAERTGDSERKGNAEITENTGTAERTGRKEQRAVRRKIDGRIANLAIPALGALIAEPLFLVVDSALIGHLGAAPLAGLAVASAILQTAVGLMIFLAYSTTPLVARRRGAGDLRGAVQAGVDGLWLALGIGIVVGAALWALSGPLITAFGADRAASTQALTFLSISCLGIPAMLIVFAASGLLRGLQDTRTPLGIATVGFAANALLNWWFIYGLGWGIAGSAWGTVLAQWSMVAVYLGVISWHARRVGAGFWPHRDGLAHTGRSGGWLFIRTLGLRVAMLATVFAAAGEGVATTAGYQIVFTLFSTAAFALDALAIAAQALVGDALGARDVRGMRAVVGRTVFWGIAFGVGIGALLAATSPFVGRVFTEDPGVLAILPLSLLVLAVSLPLGGYVFVLDGVLMGADDARYLAWTSLVNLAIFLPALWAFTTLMPTGAAGLAALTAAFTIVFMAARALTLGLRARGERWVKLGA